MSSRDHVLVVDDDPSVVHVVQTLLEDEDYDVSVAFNGKEALEAILSGLSPDLIILDVMMPILDGWGFWQATRSVETLAEVPVVVVSADGTMPAKAAEAGVPAYLRKPFEMDELLLTIEQLLERRAQRSYQEGYRAGLADGHQDAYRAGYLAGHRDAQYQQHHGRPSTDQPDRHLGHRPNGGHDGTFLTH